MSDLLHVLRAIVRDELKHLRLGDVGVVTATLPHAEGDTHNYECNVKLRELDLELRNVPMTTPHVGMASAPREGDLVLITYVGGDPNRPIVAGRLYSDKANPPIHEAGEWRVESPLAGLASLAIDKEESIVITTGKNVVTIRKDAAIEITGEVFAELLYPQLRAHLLARPPRHRDIENADVEREDEEPAELLVDAVTASKLDRERLPAIDTEAIQVRYADGHLRLFVDQRALDPDADKRTNALAAIYAVLLDDVYGALAEEVSVEIAAFTSYDEYGEGALASAKILWKKTLDREGLARMIADVSAAGATR